MDDEKLIGAWSIRFVGNNEPELIQVAVVWRDYNGGFLWFEDSAGTIYSWYSIISMKKADN